MDWLLQHIEQELGAFMSAPVLCLSFLLIGGSITWLFHRREVRGLRSERLAIEQRLSLARESEQKAISAREVAEKELTAVQARLWANAPSQEIASGIASVKTSLVETGRAQDRVMGTLQVGMGQSVMIVGPNDV